MAAAPGDEQLIEHWAALVRVTHGLVDSHEDAEDCASAAVLQLLERGQDEIVSDEAYLVTVAKRRAIDRTRSQVRWRARDRRLAGLQPPGAPDVAEDVVARAEAAWLDETARSLLSPRAYRLLRLLADGHDIADAAAKMAMTQRAAESLLLRSRRTVRRAWAKTLAVLGGAAAALRRWGPASAPAATLAASAVLALAVPGQWSDDRGPQPSSPSLADDDAGARSSSSLGFRPDPSGTWTVRTTQRAHAAAGRRAGPPPAQTVAVVRAPMHTDTRITKERRRGQAASPVDTIVQCAQDFVVTREHIGC